MIFATVVHEVTLPSMEDMLWRSVILLAVLTVVQLLQNIYVTLREIEEEIVPPRCPERAALRQRERVEQIKRIRDMFSDAASRQA